MFIVVMDDILLRNGKLCHCLDRSCSRGSSAPQPVIADAKLGLRLPKDPWSPVAAASRALGIVAGINASCDNASGVILAHNRPSGGWSHRWPTWR